MGQRRVASPVTATTDLLAAAILNKYGRAFPAIDRALQRTLRPIAEGHSSFDGPRPRSRDHVITATRCEPTWCPLLAARQTLR